ncbi:MAG: MarR family transcriptional regulator [Lunatimonas sp.]|nr:MarR family transcriptional regulator [Lunatimonas sp.]
MSSPFDPIQQENNLDAKITFTLDRISLVFKSMQLEQSKKTNLSPIQLQILVFLLYHSPEMHRVSYLAQEFNLTKATISDSVKALIQKGLIRKVSDPSDSRSFSLNLTSKGKDQAQDAAQMANPMAKVIGKYTRDQKEIFYGILFKTIKDLQASGLIPMQRMCFSCASYQIRNGEHYCDLLKRVLQERHLRIDCKEHEAKQT